MLQVTGDQQRNHHHIHQVVNHHIHQVVNHQVVNHQVLNHHIQQREKRKKREKREMTDKIEKTDKTEKTDNIKKTEKKRNMIHVKMIVYHIVVLVLMDIVVHLRYCPNHHIVVYKVNQVIVNQMIENMVV